MITVTSDIDLDGHAIKGGAEPVDDADLATKKYVDDNAVEGGGAIDADDITDATVTGKALIRATDAGTARTTLDVPSTSELEAATPLVLEAAAEIPEGTPANTVIIRKGA
jgi:hypothetical protein